MPRPLIVLASAFAAIIVLAAALFTWTDMQERQVASGDPLQIVSAPLESSEPTDVAVGVGAPSAAADATAENISADLGAEAANEVPAGVAEGGTAAGSDTPANAESPDEATVAATAPEEGEVVPAIELGFDIVRVEPTGEALFAGQAAPGAKIEIVDGNAVIASTTADAEGAFVAIPEAPLAPGEHAIAVRIDGLTAPAEAQSQVAVTVPEIGGGAATIITGEEQVAAADIGLANPQLRAPKAGGTSASAQPESGGSEGAATDSETGAAAGPPTAPSEAPATTVQGSSAAAPQDTDSAKPAEQEIAPGGTVVATAPDQSATTPPSARTPAGASDAASVTAPRAASEAPTITDGVATPGSAPDASAAPTNAEAAAPGAVRTESPAEAARDPTAGTARAETEVAAIPGDGSTAAPDASAAGAVIRPGAPANGANADSDIDTAAGTSGAATEESEPVANPTVGAPSLAIKAAEAEARQLYVAGEAAPGALVRVYANDDLVGEARTNSNGAWLVEASKELAVGEVVIRADAVASRSETPSAHVELPFVRYADGIVLEPAASAAAAPAAAAAISELQPPSYVLIRRGDNLWRISRRNYGRGIRFKTIFAANKNLIRNPHRIYPGQVFVLPKRDTSWATAIN